MVKKIIKTIPKEIKTEVIQIVEDFNKSSKMPKDCFYKPRFKGRFCNLDRSDFGTIGQICRIEYTGDKNKWRFEMFLWSTETYTNNMDCCSEIKIFDGTIEGAMKAGLSAYPVEDVQSGKIFDDLKALFFEK